MSRCTCFWFWFFAAIVCGHVSKVAASQARCDDDGTLPVKLQTALAACQSDLQSLIMHGFFRGLFDLIKAQKQEPERAKRGASLPGREDIAGCMLLCMFRKLKSVDEEEVPTVEGLIKNFGEGVKQRGYFLAMTQAVQKCVAAGRKHPQPSEDSTTHKCVVSYKIFDCVRGEIMDYCEGN